MPRRAEQARAVEKRQAILSAASEIMLSEGLNNVTHRQVAAKAGVPVGSIGYYYDSREKLLQTCLELVDETRSKLFAEVSTRVTPETSVEQLAEWIVHATTLGGKTSLASLVAVAIDALRETGELPNLVRGHCRNHKDEIESLLAIANIDRKAAELIYEDVVGVAVHDALKSERKSDVATDAVISTLQKFDKRP
ncbi:TetR family transcriptional regulator [Corynebacterium breve]|uniref:TetR family transcriptional regulator n=1 Tax=Corynebacterium breve TaxID=3049799 RepID=A0ABY8VBW7_9CORY|nr:TetR family transcriptional regulator [Corynebacterium breve]WIM67164.1 TetR family transcriptional regulator [Corynebacterium breve]